MVRLLLSALVLCLAAFAAQAQGRNPATLVADRVFLNGDDTIIAEGAVEVIYDGARLTASRIFYDQTSDRLTIDGPIRLSDGKGTVILADAADLSTDFRDGIMQSARMVMEDQLQIAANELTRVGGRYMKMTRVVASSCQVCAANPTPLWEIRATRVIHDEQRQRLYFDNAQLRLAGLPVFYLPRLRLPEPGVDRATGFLVPRLRTTTQLGTGILLPYFIAIGDSRDLTITPYFSTSVTRTVELRYRQAFRSGNIEFTGAVSRDNIGPKPTRGYVFGNGTFRLPQDFRLSFNIEDVSDPAYLLDYDISSKDRLSSFLRLDRTRRDERMGAQVTRYETIRPSERNATLPTEVGDLTYGRRFDMPGIGGIGMFDLGLHGHRRESTIASDSDGDGIADGRDILRATAVLGWQGSTVLPAGLIGAAQAELALGSYAVSDDTAFPARVERAVPTLSAELRWPLVRHGRDGSSQVLEPVAQIVWSPKDQTRVPNEDGLLLEFDEASLFEIDRFPGEDAKERGLRANLGLSWTRHDPDGWSMGITGGRVLRPEDLGQFTSGSGLGGTRSDWLLATQFDTGNGLAVMNRILLGDDLGITQNELRLRYAGQRFDVAANYIWLEPDARQNRNNPTEQLSLATGFNFAEGWRGTAGARYDLASDRATRANIGLGFRNECAEVDLSLSRRFTTSTSVAAVTDFNFQVTLNGFGQRPRGQSYRQSCGG